MRRAAALALVLGLVAPPALAAEGKVELSDIEDEVMCPICGTPLQLSEAPQANRERALIRRLIDRGESKQEIKDALVAEYGREVLATPDDEGFDLAAWIVPAAGILLAALAAFFAVRRWRRSAKPAPSAALPDEDAERLDDDIARYDL